MIVTADSVTELAGLPVQGNVLVAGSHAGVVAARYAAQAGVRAVILHDAGLGKDDAGISGLAWLEAIGMAAAAVAHASAPIADGARMLARGTISHANSSAAKLGVAPGMLCHAAAVRLLAAPLQALPSSIGEEAAGRFELAPGVVGVDSVGLVEPGDAGKVLVTGSHAALHGGRIDSALAVDAALAFFHEGGSDCSRLAALDARGIAAAAVDGASARIGDARSLWEGGIVSNPNRAARAAGIRPGMSVRDAVRTFLGGASPELIR
jgi:hypothetical protein